MLNYNIKGTEVEITPELRSYVETRLAHSCKLLEGDTTAHADVELQHSVMRDGGKYRAEFTVSSGGTIYRTEDWGGTMHEAIDIAAGELARELTKNKKKNLKVFRHSALKVKEFLRGWRKKV